MTVKPPSHASKFTQVTVEFNWEKMSVNNNVAQTQVPLGGIENLPLSLAPSFLRGRRPCFELLCTNMFSETANKVVSVMPTAVEIATWKRRISRGLPAFFRQFWLHFMKNLMKYLQRRTNRNKLSANWWSRLKHVPVQQGCTSAFAKREGKKLIRVAHHVDWNSQLVLHNVYDIRWLTSCLTQENRFNLLRFSRAVTRFAFALES